MKVFFYWLFIRSDLLHQIGLNRHNSTLKLSNGMLYAVLNIRLTAGRLFETVKMMLISYFMLHI